MTRRVVPGEPILPHMTAAWFNKTLEQPQQKPSPPGKDLRHHNEDAATFVPSTLCTKAERFTAVAPIGRTDTLGKHVKRAQYVDKESLTKSNWIITQAEMGTGYRTQTCVYAGVTYAKVNILNPNHKFVDLNLDTLELESSTSGKGLLLEVGGEYAFISIESYAAPATVVVPNEPTEECTGVCRFEVVSGEWVEVSSTCNTTTTTTSTTSTSDSTTTYHDQDCRGTTSPPPENTCECLWPIFCPTESDQCTYTSCSKTVNTQKVCTPTTTTTTTPCNCDTTTTGASGDPNTCTYTHDQNGTPILVENNCPPGCDCFIVESDDPCVETVVGCNCPPPEPIDPCSCAGAVNYFCDGNKWVYASGGCARSGDCEDDIACITDVPTQPCVECGNSISVPCGFNQLPTTPTTTSGEYVPCSAQCDYCYGCPTTSVPTTTTPEECSLPCLRQWDGALWNLIQATCVSPCFCSEVAFNGRDTCEVIAVPCINPPPTTSTTTTTTTTTSTTSSSTTTTPCAPAGPNAAVWQCVGGNWILVDNNCDLGYIPAQVPGSTICDGSSEGDCQGYGCVSTTTSSTTTTTTTTTTTSTTSSTTTSCAPCDVPTGLVVWRCEDGFFSVFNNAFNFNCTPGYFDQAGQPCVPDCSCIDCNSTPTS